MANASPLNTKSRGTNLILPTNHCIPQLVKAGYYYGENNILYKKIADGEFVRIDIEVAWREYIGDRNNRL